MSWNRKFGVDREIGHYAAVGALLTVSQQLSTVLSTCQHQAFFLQICRRLDSFIFEMCSM